MSTVNGKSRRHLLAALGALSVLSLLRLPTLRPRRKTISCGPPSGADAPPLRVLTQDGQLVEVDASKITVVRKKISNEELKGWVRRPS